MAGRSRSASARATPATARPHGGDHGCRIVAPVGRDVDDAGDLTRRRHDAAVGASSAGHEDVEVGRDSDDETFVVVDLSTDEVHARGARKRRHRASRSARAASSGTTGLESVPLPSSPDAT